MTSCWLRLHQPYFQAHASAHASAQVSTSDSAATTTAAVHGSHSPPACLACCCTAWERAPGSSCLLQGGMRRRLQRSGRHSYRRLDRLSGITVGPDASRPIETGGCSCGSNSGSSGVSLAAAMHRYTVFQ